MSDMIMEQTGGIDMAHGIKIRVPQLLRERNVTPYRLFTDTGIAPGTAYRLASETKSEQMEGITFATLSALCDFFGVGVGDILEFCPDDRP